MASFALRNQDPPRELEHCYTVQEIAQQWQLHEDTIIRMFRDEPGVLKISTPQRGKRSYTTLRIPKSVLERMQRRLGR